MKILLTVILLSSIIAAQNTYSIQPGVNNNQIVLELSNTSLSESANNLEVKLIKNSNHLTFNQTEKTIENIIQGEETEIAFTFDVNYNIGNVEADTLEFMITDNKSVYLTKQFILQYALPTEYKLEQNYPNPFNPTTKIRFSIPNVIASETKQSAVKLIVYDILGNEVRTLVNEQKEPGYYEVDFSATDGASRLASGVYIYRLQADSYVSTKKMMVLK